MSLRTPVLCLFALAATLSPAAADPKKVSYRDAVEEMATFTPQEAEGAYVRGEALYNRVCASCHGTLDRPPVVPNSRVFHQQPMLNGADPYKMFLTLEKGFNQMIPQPWMDPVQKLFVIHYIRETFFKEHNPSQYTEITEDYIASVPDDKVLELPEGRWRTNAVTANQYLYIDYGPHFFGHVEVSPNNRAYKGLIVPLDLPPTGNITAATSFAMYDLDTLRLAAVWDGGFIDFDDLEYNGIHKVHCKVTGTPRFVSDERPAWAAPGSETFEDPREKALDQRRYGPLPRDHARYLGYEVDGTLRYRVGDTEIRETVQPTANGAVQRTLVIAPHTEPLLHLAAPAHQSIRVEGAARVDTTPDGHVVTIAKAPEERTVHIFVGADPQTLAAAEPADPADRNTPPADTRTVQSEIVRLDSPLDTLEVVIPQFVQNPWNGWIRPAGVDFLSDGSTAIVASWIGDVFRVDNATGDAGEQVTWTRIATGLHQPLGLKVVDDAIYVGCRDQIIRLHDRDGDHRADYYECFNSDHQVSIHFHEFAAGLDTDSQGNFYYVKAGRHDKPALFKQHGSVIKVAADGSSSQTIAHGFRSANGVFVDHDDTIWATDQEGHWHPQNRINRVRPGGFYGNMLGWFDPWKVDYSDASMDQPLVWVPKAFENSPSEVLRFPDEGWGPISGEMAYLSYALGRVMMLPHQELDGDPKVSLQGATYPLPIPDFKTGTMRARFHPETKDLFLCGLFGWGSQRVQDGGLFRVRYNEAPLHVPTGFEARQGELVLTLSEPVSKASADPQLFTARSYHIERSRRYGSELEDETPLTVTEVDLSSDGRTLTLAIPSLAPTRVLDLQYQLVTTDGETLDRHLTATIHRLE